jgi:large subunit ribosomal protein L24
MKRFRSGDEVIIVAGKSKGHIGKLLQVNDETVVVQGGNLMKKHVKSNPQKPESTGGIISREAALHVSNIAHYNPVTKKAGKIGFKFLDNDKENKKVRYFKSNNEIIDRV